MSPTGNPHRPRHRGRGTASWDREMGTSGDLTAHGEPRAEDLAEAHRGHRNPVGEYANDRGPTGHGWAPEPMGDGGVI